MANHTRYKAAIQSLLQTWMASVNSSPKAIIFPFRPEDQDAKNTLRKSENETISPVDNNEKKISTRKENSEDPKKEAKKEEETKTKKTKKEKTKTAKTTKTTQKKAKTAKAKNKAKRNANHLSLLW